MYCLKCGKETENEQVFCSHCLQVMTQYPVKPGTHITLPRREQTPQPRKASRRRVLSQDEQIQQLQGTVRVLTACLLAACLLLGVFAWLHFRPDDTPSPAANSPIGQNYTVDNTGN